MIQTQLSKIFIFYDKPIVVAGLRAILAEHEDLEVVGWATDLPSASIGLSETGADLVVLEPSHRSSTGTLVLKDLLCLHPAIRVVGLTNHEEGALVREFLQAGGRGFILKRSTAEEVVAGIRSALRGGVYVDPVVASKAMVAARPASDKLSSLSDREEHVVRLVSHGYSNKDVARELQLSVKTVETYRARAYDKLDIHNRPALVRYAMTKGWLGLGAAVQ